MSNSENETKNIARKLARSGAAMPFCLYGELGAGKTVFVKGFAEGLGIPEKRVKSPTFNFIREYSLIDSAFSHCDFYRLERIDEILARQLEEAYEKGPVIIEWADRAGHVLPEKRTDVFFEYIDAGRRKITIKTHD